MKGVSRGLEGGLRRASRGLQGGLRRASRGLQGGFNPFSPSCPPPCDLFCFTCLHNAFMHVDMYA